MRAKDGALTGARCLGTLSFVLPLLCLRTLQLPSLEAAFLKLKLHPVCTRQKSPELLRHRMKEGNFSKTVVTQLCPAEGLWHLGHKPGNALSP